MVLCVSKDMCLPEIGLYVQNMLNSLNTIFNIIKKGLHDHLVSMKILHLENAIGGRELSHTSSVPLIQAT